MSPIGVQPNCCEKWLAISLWGWMYDLNIVSGKLTRPRFTGLQNRRPPENAAGWGGTWGCTRHPQTGLLYGFEHALSHNACPWLIIDEETGSWTKIGEIKPAADYSFPNNGWEQGVTGNGMCFGLDGSTAYINNENGTGRRNDALMIIDDITTGVGRSLMSNYNGTWGNFQVSGCNGIDVHPDNGLLYGMRLTDTTDHLFPDAKIHIGTIDTGSGVWTETGTTNRSYNPANDGYNGSDGVWDLKFDRTSEAQPRKAYSIGYDHVWVCDDVLSQNAVIREQCTIDRTGIHPNDVNPLTGDPNATFTSIVPPFRKTA